MNQVLGAGGAIAGAIAAPLIVLFLLAAEEPEQPSTPTNVQLDIDLTEEPDGPGQDAVHYVEIEAPGKIMRDSDEVVATDPGGLNLATITVAENSDLCTETARRVRLPEPNVSTCLKILGLGAGSASSVVVADVPADSEGTVASLTLNLQSRHNFLFAPLFTAIFGILAAGGLSLAIPSVKRKNTAWRLHQAIEDNRHISGWDYWILLSRDTLSLEDQVTKVRHLGKSASLRATKYRNALTAEHNRNRLPSNHPVNKAADDAAIDESLDVWHFYNEKGENVTHPALALINPLTQIGDFYDRAKTWEKLIPEPDATNEKEVKVAQSALATHQQNLDDMRAPPLVKSQVAKADASQAELANKIRDAINAAEDTSELLAQVGPAFQADVAARGLLPDDLGEANLDTLDEAKRVQIDNVLNQLAEDDTLDAAKLQQYGKLLNQLAALEGPTELGILKQKFDDTKNDELKTEPEPLPAFKAENPFSQNVGIGAIALLAGVVTLWVANYEPSATFGTLLDYLTLLTAALASGSAATLAGLTASYVGLPTE